MPSKKKYCLIDTDAYANHNVFTDDEVFMRVLITGGSYTSCEDG
jgi:hypothetical protein